MSHLPPDTEAVNDFESKVFDWIGTDPKMALVELDRDIVRVGGLRAFTELNWPKIKAEGSFKGNWHIDEICFELTEVSDGTNKRLGIAVPPQHMKSISVAVCWPAWDWTDNPHRRFLFASYAQSLSMRDSVKCRRII